MKLASRFVPDAWQLSDKLRQWTLDYRHEGKRIDPSTIDDLVEEFRDIEFPAPRRDFDRCFRRFIRTKSTKGWGGFPKFISPQRRPEALTEDDRQRDILKWRQEMIDRGYDPDNLVDIRKTLKSR